MQHARRWSLLKSDVGCSVKSHECLKHRNFAAVSVNDQQPLFKLVNSELPGEKQVTASRSAWFWYVDAR